MISRLVTSTFGRHVRPHWCTKVRRDIVWRMGVSASERHVFVYAFAPRIRRRSTGSDCRTHDCRPKIAPAVAIVERVILAVPTHIACAHRNHRAPRSLGALSACYIDYRCKSSGSHQNCAYHHLSTLHAGASNKHQRGCRYFNPRTCKCVTLERDRTKPSGKINDTPSARQGCDRCLMAISERLLQLTSFPGGWNGSWARGVFNNG